MLGLSCSDVIKEENQTNNDTTKSVSLSEIDKDTTNTIKEWKEIRSTIKTTREDISKILNRINELEKEVLNDTIREKINTLR
tara:strand:- start:868 stop:1113 length:246 start_codon:yes stop_codon:yes gene_type:complete